MVNSREYQIALANAMGLPTERCTGVDVNVKWDSLVEVTATYTVTRDELEQAAKALRTDG